MDKAISLSLTVQPESLTVAVANIGKTPQRLWDRNSSWGWEMFSLLLAGPDEDEWRELTATPIRWTRNVPRALELLPGGTLRYALGPGDPGWDGLSALGERRNQPMKVRVRLRIPPTPEAATHDVSVGEAVSPPAWSHPPHGWLT